MSDFRKLLLAFAVVTLLAGVASAQFIPSATTITCGTSAQPLTVRDTGLSEQTGDVLITCSGGTAPTVGSTLPQVNISVTLSANITSRLLADPLTEALLFIDDPQPGNQNPCAPSQGSTVCSPLTAGAGGAALDATGVNRNVFQGTKQSDNTIVWLAVPISAPGTNATRTFRTKNVRAAISGTSAANGQIFAYVSIQNPPANLQLNNSSVNVAFVQQGLVFDRRSASGGGYSSTAQMSGGSGTTSGGTLLYQCDNFNAGLNASATGRYNGSNGGPQGRSMTVRFTEFYAASFKVRDINPALTEPGGQQNIPQANNGAPPSGNGTVVESGFFNTGFTTTNGLNRAGRADHGTRLRLALTSVPTNLRVYVSTHSLNVNQAYTTNSPDGNRQSGAGAVGGSNGTLFSAAFGVATDSTGRNIAGGTVLSNPTSDAELWDSAAGGLPARFPGGATPGLIEVPLTGGAGSFTWEVFAQDPNQIDAVLFALVFASRNTNNPGTGTANVSGSFAPTSTDNKMSSTSPLPRFSESTQNLAAIQVNICQTSLLFPFLTNQAGFDTGVAIANTTSDPFGTAAQTGNCTMNYYGQTTGGGAAPSPQTTTSTLTGGQTLVFSLSSGGSNGIAATPGFQGYMIAVCQFRLAHGYAFISDLGSQKLAQGYLALIMERTGNIPIGENLNN